MQIYKLRGSVRLICIMWEGAGCADLQTEGVRLICIM